ncbi:MAG: ABC transporter permease, partial [Dehalococcoidia bacterium]
FGAPQEALSYFGVQEIEQIYDLLEEQRKPEDWEQQYRTSEVFRERITTPLVRQQAATLPDPTRRRVRRRRQGKLPAVPEAWRQFWILTARYTRTTLKDRKHLAVLLLQAPVIALLLWALFAQNVFEAPNDVTVVAWNSGHPQLVPKNPQTGGLVGNPGSDLVAISGQDCVALASGQPGDVTRCHISAGNGNNQALKAAQLAFLLAATAVWLGTLAAIGEISKEHAIYQRERLVNLRVAPYIASKFAVLFVFVVLQSALLLGVTAGYIHFPRDVLGGAYLALLLGGAASVAVALAVSAAVTNPERAIVFAPLIMVPQILLAGGLSPVGQLGIAKPLSAIVATRWTYEAVGRVFGVVREAAIPEQFPYADALRGDATGRWLILLGFIAGFGLLATLFQRLKDRR